MYRVKEHYFKSDSDKDAIYQYASFLTMSNDEPDLIKIKEDKEKVLCKKEDVKKLIRVILQNDKRVRKVMENI